MWRAFQMGIVQGMKACMDKLKGKNQQASYTATRITLRQLEEDVQYKFANFQHIGKRKHQEDAFGFSNVACQEILSTKGFMAILADGMGGLANGNLASQMTVEGILKGYESLNIEESIPDQLKGIVEHVNRCIYNALRMEGGSTLAAVFIVGKSLYWISVGDSHIYLKRQGRIYQINEDHIYLKELYQQVLDQEMTKAEALSNGQRGALTEYMGKDQLDKIDMSLRAFKLEAGDKLLLCSDGVYGSLGQEEISGYLDLEIGECCNQMQQSILMKDLPYQDNLTGLIIVME